MRTLIVDDEPLARDGLRLLLGAHPDLEVVGEAGNGREASSLIAATQPDLVLLDIHMPEVDGLDVAAALHAAGGPAIIFVTAHDRYALRAFDVDAVDYLMKPVSETRLATALARARARPRPAARLAVRDGDRTVYLTADEIDWIEAADYYVEIHARGASFLHREPLRDLARFLGPARFIRIHRSRLVNRDRVRELQRHDGELFVVLDGGPPLRVARSHRAEVLALHPRPP
jgi:two-component system, LytTR family, response regulator